MSATYRPEQRPEQRIAKLLARAGVASRREVERMIAEGRIALDGKVLETPATLLRSLHGVTVDGEPVAPPAPARLFLFHKPSGLLTTERDPAGRPTIYDRLPADLPRLVPVGRLDLNTEGLLLLTTDGGLKRQLELPATGVERAYRARAYGEVAQAQLEELIEGVEIDGMRYGPIDANLERRTGANTWIEMILTEGKNREVRRVLEHLGLEVSRLIRTRYGPFLLGDLQPGQIGEVRQHDLVAFRRSLEKKGAPTEAVVVEARLDPPRASLGEGDHAKHGGGAVATGAARRPRPLNTRASGPSPRTSSERTKEPRPAREGEKKGGVPRQPSSQTSGRVRPATNDRTPPAPPSKGKPRPPGRAASDDLRDLTTSRPRQRGPARPGRPTGPVPPHGPRRPGKR